MRGALAALGLLLVLASTAGAHFDAFSAAVNVRAGEWTVYVNPTPAPLYAGRAFNWSVYVGEGAMATALADATVVVRVVSGPEATGTEWTLARAPEPGTHRAAAVFPAAGRYNVSILVEAPDAVERANASFEVYPDLGARIVPEVAGLDVYANRTAKVGFLTVRDERAVDVWPDLTIRFEHWSDDHRVLHWATDRALRPSGVGKFTVEYDFPQKGMYHMTFASAAGNFGFEDTPLLHVYAIEPVVFDEPRNGSSGAGAVAVLAAGAASLMILRRRV